MPSKYGEALGVTPDTSASSLEAYIETQLEIHPGLRRSAILHAGHIAEAMVEEALELPEVFAARGMDVSAMPKDGGLASNEEVTAVTTEMTIALGGLVAIFTDPANPDDTAATGGHFTTLLSRLYRDVGYDLISLPAAIRAYATSVWELPAEGGKTAPGISGPHSADRFRRAFRAIFPDSAQSSIPRQRQATRQRRSTKKRHR